jgi:hypothetical protein
MKDLVGSNPAFGRGFIEPFVVIGDDVTVSEQELCMMARVIPPNETSGA